MSAFSHVKSDAIADFTGTVTGFNSQGSTTTIVATNLVRPSDWNSAHNFFQTISGNTAGTSTASGTNLIIGGLNGIEVSHSTAAGAATLWIQKQVQDGFYPAAVFEEPVVGQHGQATWHFQPMRRLEPFKFDRLVIPIFFSNASNSSGSGTLSFWFGLYSQSGSTLSMLHSISSTQAVTMSGTAGSFSLFGGSRDLTIPWTSTIDEGGYWAGIASRSTTGGANMTISQWFASQPNSNHSGIFGVASNATNQALLGQGYYSASSTDVPASVAFSQIRGTASLAQRVPVFYFQSGTV